MILKIELEVSEVLDLLENLDQCESEGYMNFGDPAFSAKQKLLDAIREYDLNTDYRYGDDQL